MWAICKIVYDCFAQLTCFVIGEWREIATQLFLIMAVSQFSTACLRISYVIFLTIPFSLVTKSCTFTFKLRCSLMLINYYHSFMHMFLLIFHLLSILNNFKKWKCYRRMILRKVLFSYILFFLNGWYGGNIDISFLLIFTFYFDIQ